MANIVADRESREKAFAKLAESSQGVRDEYVDVEAQSALEEAESRLAELSETYAKYESTLNKFRSMEIEMESELEELSQSVTDAKGTKKHWNACLASTREKYDVAAAEYAAARGDDVPEEDNRLGFLSLSAD